MNIPTCYRCPERKRNGKRCEILQEKLNAVRGLGLSSIGFHCEKRLRVFSPGEIVEFEIYSKCHDGPSHIQCRGIVMRMKARKVLVYVDGDRGDSTERPIINLWPNRLHKTGEHHPVCIHCGKPKDKELRLTKAPGAEPEPWICRNEWNEDSGLDGITLPCEYEIPEAVKES